jgi:predicted RNase H-like HicB family nuclease
MRRIVLYRDETGMWVVECPSLPGCVSQGETREEAVENIKTAIKLYLEVLQEDGMPIPEEKTAVEVLLCEATPRRVGRGRCKSAQKGGIRSQAPGKQPHSSKQTKSIRACGRPWP